MKLGEVLGWAFSILSTSLKEQNHLCLISLRPTAVQSASSRASLQGLSHLPKIKEQKLKFKLDEFSLCSEDWVRWSFDSYLYNHVFAHAHLHILILETLIRLVYEMDHGVTPAMLPYTGAKSLGWTKCSHPSSLIKKKSLGLYTTQIFSI